jgi:hypothetical protein
VGGIILGTLIICAITWLLIGASSRPRPSDEQMIDTYNQHKAEFNQLAQMLINEKEFLVIFPEPEHCQVENQRLLKGSDNERCADYVQRFKQLGLNWSYSGSEPLRLQVYAAGLWLAGIYKGYLYTSTTPSPLVSNAEDFQGRKLPIYRQIEGDWYIYLDGQ